MDSNTLRSRQLNPCDHLFWKCRGYSERPHNWKSILSNSGYYTTECQDDLIQQRRDAEHLKSLQNNPNNIEYWRSRGWSYRPDDWYERVFGDDDDEDSSDNDDEDSDEYDEEDDYDDDEEFDSEEYDDEDDEDDEEEDEEYDQQWLKSLQNNPNNIEYWRLRGYSFRPSNWRGNTSSA